MECDCLILKRRAFKLSTFVDAIISSSEEPVQLYFDHSTLLPPPYYLIPGSLIRLMLPSNPKSPIEAPLILLRVAPDPNAVAKALADNLLTAFPQDLDLSQSPSTLARLLRSGVARRARARPHKLSTRLSKSLDALFAQFALPLTPAPEMDILPPGKPGQAQFFTRMIAHLNLTPSKLVIDACGGTGILAYAIRGCFPFVERVVIIDNGDPIDSDDLEAPIEFLNKDITTTSSLLAQADLVVALHACGGLSEFLLKECAVNRVPALVCTCCFVHHRHLCHQSASVIPPEVYKLAESPDRAISEKAMLTINGVRVRWLREKGMNAFVTSMPRSLTVRNEVIVSLPQ